VGKKACRLIDIADAFFNSEYERALQVDEAR
jgi:hypothetical protein